MHRRLDLAPDLLLVLVARVGSEKDLDLLDPKKIKQNKKFKKTDNRSCSEGHL